MKKTDPEITEIVSENKYTHLDFLAQLTSGNHDSMAEMIKIFIEQTPAFINTMKVAIDKKDWESVHRSIHSMIPSFSVMGINDQYEQMARTIQDNAINKENPEQTKEMILKLEEVCLKACDELKAELHSWA